MKRPKQQNLPIVPKKTGRERHRDRLRLMAAQVKAVLAELPHAADLHGELEETLLVLQYLEAEHDLLTAQLVRICRHRNASLEQAEDLSSRLAALLYGTFGRDRLRELGLPVCGGKRGPRPRPSGIAPQVN